MPVTAKNLLEWMDLLAKVKALPSRSFLDPDMLILVRPNDTTLFEYLQRSFAGVRYVKVIWDRRAGERRREQRLMTADRRHQTRRTREGKVSSLGYTVTSLKPK